MQVVHSIEAFRQARRALTGTLAFVPTMGYLHEGHLSLMRAGRDKADHLIVSIYVNPTQFGPNEDLDRYPRDEEGDLAKCKNVGADIVFMPTNEMMYPNGYKTRVHVPELAQGLCGAGRPEHFDGVTTIVSKLFNIVQPDLAIFGQKDFQQLAVIRAMVRDLNFPIEIVGGPIVREEDGLAMSSRNAYLSKEQRVQARALKASLGLAKRLVSSGERDGGILLRHVRAFLDNAPGVQPEYVELVDPDTLRPLAQIDKAGVIAMACRVGKTRLIDNTRLEIG